MKVLCVLLPHFPLACEVMRNRIIAGRLSIVTAASGSQKLVLDYSPELDGLQADMPLQEALSRHGQAELLQADMPYYRSIFNRVLDALERISPLVEGADMGCIYVGADGLQLMYSDDDALIDAVFVDVAVVFKGGVKSGAGRVVSQLGRNDCSNERGTGSVLEQFAAGQG